MTLHFFLLAFALLMFIIGALNVSSKINVVSLGLAAWVLTLLVFVVAALVTWFVLDYVG